MSQGMDTPGHRPIPDSMQAPATTTQNGSSTAQDEHPAAGDLQRPPAWCSPLPIAAVAAPITASSGGQGAQAGQLPAGGLTADTDPSKPCRDTSVSQEGHTDAVKPLIACRGRHQESLHVPGLTGSSAPLPQLSSLMPQHAASPQQAVLTFDEQKFMSEPLRIRSSGGDMPEWGMPALF